MKFKLVTLLLLGLILSAQAEVLSKDISQTEMNQDGCGQYKEAEEKLNRVYQGILTNEVYAKNKDFIQAFKTAQRQWMAYRDAELAAMFPGADKQGEYGSVYPMCQCQELARLTRQRIEALQPWVDGAQAGDVCAGSIKGKP